MVGRLQHLETMGLATATGPGEWMVGLAAERTLRDLGMRGDIIKTMHRALTERGFDRGVGDYVIDIDAAASPIVGRLVDKGLHDELTGEAYAVIDGTDGRAHYIRFRDVRAFEHAPPTGGIVEVRRFGGADDQRPTLVLANRSDFDLARQVTAPGATWLDHRLVEREPMPLSVGGFGGEVRQAMAARAEHLADEGLGRRQAQRIILQRDLLDTLRQRELERGGSNAICRNRATAPQGRRRRACGGHLSSDGAADLRPVRHDRQRPGFPAGSLGHRHWKSNSVGMSPAW